MWHRVGVASVMDSWWLWLHIQSGYLGTICICTCMYICTIHRYIGTCSALATFPLRSFRSNRHKKATYVQASVGDSRKGLLTRYATSTISREFKLRMDDT